MSASATLVEPAFCTHPEFRETLGPEVAELCERAGFGPDPQQRLGLDLIFAMRPRGLPLTLECAVCVGRQNLKTGLIKQAVLGKAFLLEQRLIVWSAHEFATSAEAFRDLRDVIEGCPELDRRVLKIREGHGDESIELDRDRRIIFKTRTRTGGRGLTGDTVVLDEAMYLSASHMGTLIPTLSARPEPQVLYGGSAGLPESAVWRDVRNRGRAGGDPSLCWLEWCDDLPGDCGTPQCMHRPGTIGCRLDQEERWFRANPTLGLRITVDFVRAERRALPVAEFGRERLGWWDDPDDDAEQLLVDWAACADPASAPAGQPVYAVDVSPGSRSASIVAALWRDDDLPHVEVVEHRPGTDWVAERCAELEAAERWEWVLDPAGPAGALLPDLEAVGITCRQVTSRELGQACEAFSAAVRAREVRHLADPLLTQALQGSGRRDIGDGLWAWSRRKSGADISPLYGATLALWVISELGPDDVTVIVV